MKSEDEAIANEEIVLRLVWKDFYKSGDPLKIKPRAFHPRVDETTGISVFRDECLSDPTQALLALPDPVKRPLYLISGLEVTVLQSLGLTVKPDKIETVPGHCVMVELNSDSWMNDKATWLPIVEQLAELASKNVLHVPAN